MRWYRAVVRSLFAHLFIGGGVVHIVQGRAAPDGYAVFGGTALWGLARLWASFVMPNIGWLTLVTAGFEVAAGMGLLLGGRPLKIAAAAILGFFAFLPCSGTGSRSPAWARIW